MAYQTGTATTSNDLLDKLRLFVIAQGWTVNRWVSAGSGNELCIQNGSSYFNFRSYSNETVVICGTSTASKYGIGLNGSDAYSAGLTWDRQTGYPIRASASAGVDQIQAYVPFITNFGPFSSYHFLSPNSNNIHVEIEVTTGCYLRFGFGSLDLFNSSAAGGGRYFYGPGSDGSLTFTGSSSSWLGANIESGYTLEEVPFRGASISANFGQIGSFLRAAFDSFDGWCSSTNSPTNNRTNQACQGGGCHDKVLYNSGANSINGIGILTPNVISINRSDINLSPVGTIPGLRFMDMTRYLPGEEFTIGLDTWKVFPWYQKGGRSFQRGIAYKKVP